MIVFSVFPSRRLLRRGEIFLGPDLRCVLDVRVIGSGVMDSSLPFLTVLMSRALSAADGEAAAAAGDASGTTGRGVWDLYQFAIQFRI